MTNIFPIDFEEKLTMAQDDYILFSDSEDGNKIKKAQYKNLKGEKGDTGATGAAATISVGTTTTGDAGTSASVTNSGTSSAAVLNFTIPKGTKGDTGSAATITVGTTTTGAAGTNATVTNSGTSSAAVLNFTIPRGADGTGSGDVVGPASSTDGHLAVFDGATGKLIKDGGAMPTIPTKVSDLSNDSGYLTSSTGVTTVNGNHGAVAVQETLVSGTNIKTINNESLLGSGDITITGGGSDIEYVTQAEYEALLPGALTDNKHYFIYEEEVGPTPPTPGVRPTITGFTYDSKTFSVPQSTYGDVNSIVWKPDGTKFYIAGETYNTVYQFSCSTPYDISTASYDNKSKSVSAQENVTASIIFSDDGLTMWIGGGRDQGHLYQYTLSTAWDVSTATYDNIQSNIAFGYNTSHKIYNNGQYVYFCYRQDDPNMIYRYTMTTPYNITTIDSGSGISFTCPSKCAIHEVVINPDGTQMFTLFRATKSIGIYSLSTAWDITTATLSSTYSIPTPNSNDITSLTIDNGGNNMYIGGYGLNNLYQYSTTTA